jgi:hypothetical protein
MFIETGTKLDEYRTLSTIETRLRVLDDDSETEVLTEASECHGCCTLEYEAGTTGAKGGDWGHGSRVYLRLENAASVGWQIKTTKDKVEIILGGDEEINAIQNALRFMLRTLEEQTKNIAGVRRQDHREAQNTF